MLAILEPVRGGAPSTSVKSDLQRAREIAFVSLIVPVLFMASLVSASVLMMSDLGSALFNYWLTGQVLICGVFFLLSTREKSELFEGERDANSLIKSFPLVILAVAWGVVPGILALVEPLEMHFVFGAILSGAMLASAVLLQFTPQLGRIVLAATVGGFLANTMLQPQLVSALISMVILAYFSGLAICTRWYFSQYNKRLTEVETAAARTREINSVLRDVGFATDTFFWSIEADGEVIEINSDALPTAPVLDTIKGRDWLSLFRASPERDLLRARISRGSEIVALELELADDIEASSRFWKLSARPVFESGKFVGYRGSATDITQLRLSENRAAFLTEYDSLTGLLNRNSFKEAVSAHLDSEVRASSDSALIWIDLDNFKWINDTFGHAGGDDIIKLVAKRLELLCEPMDLLCRYGGDEFALLITRSQMSGRLLKFVDDLTYALQQPFTYAKTDLQVGASVGVRRIEPGADDVSTLMKEADLALLSAKSSGGGVWKEYSEGFKARVRGQRELAQDLAKAIDSNALNLQFQPIVDAKTGAVTAVEALSRWYHPVRGTVSPSEFIPIAEDNGIIIALGDRVIENVILAAMEMPADTKVGINVSPLQLHSSRILSLISQKIEETGIDPQRIELEITESVFLSDNAFILDRLHKLKDLGVRIAMDDFGTGFSSLAYLQRFPFDKLKLDQAFVRGLETSEQSQAIARATISMAHALNLTVTAEGVESDAQARFLREQGCDELQGFLYSRPQDQAALIPYLRSMNLLHEAKGQPGGNVVEMKRS
ncbi:MAG: bifunctional diguanylate cyclase/phosphodiesterase [Hyphomonadaceae bacterium]|nr:bifunctional diguanylate cyclase/phosphodiesterase [Hyphomonadaceae bacterium]